MQLRHKWTASARNAEVVDVVIVADDSAPRWDVHETLPRETETEAFGKVVRGETETET